jgi:hypothetical protein
MNIFNSIPRRKQNQDHRHYTSPILHYVSLIGMLPLMQKPLGMHHIRSKLFSLHLSKLHALNNSCLVNHVTNPNSNEYKLTTIVFDIAGYKLFKPVSIKKDEIDKRSFLKLPFANKGVDGITLGNLPHHKSSNLKFHHILRISPYL